MNQILYNFIYEKINYNYVREGINVDLCSEFNINVYLDLFLAGNDKTNKQNVRYYTTFPFSPKKIKKLKYEMLNYTFTKMQWLIF